MPTDTLDQPTPPEPGGGNYNVFNDLSTYIPPVEPRLTADEINAGARQEVESRMVHLAARSGQGLVPDPSIHGQIDRLLDARHNKITDADLAATQPRSAVSTTWESFND